MCRPELVLRSYVRIEDSRLDLASHPLDESFRILLNLEIPKSHDPPPSLQEGHVLPLIAGDVPLDLLVPVAAPASWLPLARVTVPEGAVDEDRDLPARERYVDATARTWPMAPKTAEAGAPQRGTKQALGPCVLAANARHDPPPALRRSRRRAERV